MPASPSIETSQSAPPPAGERLSGEQLCAAIETCGYRCTGTSLSGAGSRASGCAVSLQFGDRIAKDADGATCLTVRCSIQINNSAEHGGGECARGDITRWNIRKDVLAPGGIPRFRFAIDADLILQGDIAVTDILKHGGDIYRHLHMLLSDGSTTLYAQSINEGRGGALVAAPVVRIEAHFVGDLASGRSGVVGSNGAGDFTHPASVAAPHLRITRVACDWLKDDILPDLASAIRRTVLQTQATNHYRAPLANTAALMPERVQS